MGELPVVREMLEASDHERPGRLPGLRCGAGWSGCERAHTGATITSHAEAPWGIEPRDQTVDVHGAADRVDELMILMGVVGVGQSYGQQLLCLVENRDDAQSKS
jgi:hypothetical protein